MSIRHHLQSAITLVFHSKKFAPEAILHFFSTALYSSCHWLCSTSPGDLYHSGGEHFEVASAWTLRHPAIIGAIVGGRSTKQVGGIIGAAEFRLSEGEINEIETFFSRRFQQVGV